MRINWKNFCLICCTFLWCNLLTDYLLGQTNHLIQSVIYSCILTGIVAIIGSWFLHQDQVLSWFIIGFVLISFYERITFENGISFANMPLFLKMNFDFNNPEQWINIINPIALLFFLPLLFSVGLDILPYNKINAKSVIILLILIIAALLYNWSSLNIYTFI